MALRGLSKNLIALSATAAAAVAISCARGGIGPWADPGFVPRAASESPPTVSPTPTVIADDDFSEPEVTPEEKSREDQLIREITPELPPDATPDTLPSGKKPDFDKEETEEEERANATPSPTPSPAHPTLTPEPKSIPVVRPAEVPTPVPPVTVPTTEPKPVPPREEPIEKPAPRPAPKPQHQSQPVAPSEPEPAEPPPPPPVQRATPAPRPKPAPEPALTPAPVQIRAFWDDRAANSRKWTAYTIAALRKLGSDLLVSRPEDVRNFCPAYDRFGAGKRMSFWVKFVSAIAASESGFNPMAKLTEKKITNRKGNQVVSRGLLQISLESANAYGCGFSNEDELHYPRKNLECGVRILSRWIGKDGVITDTDRDGNWLGGARYWSVLRDSNPSLERIKKLLSETSLCQGH